MGYTGEQKREYQRQWVARRRAGYFKGKSCVKCTSTDELRLDHIDPATKVDHKIWSWSWTRIYAETAKCQVLCLPCHEVKTLAQRPITNGYIPFRHGSPAMYIHHGCRCGLCRLTHRNVARTWRASRKGMSTGVDNL